nr:uncharacterized protein LOC129164993 [Nothobranchius furzeri]
MIEEFKRHVPERLVLYLNEQKVSTLFAAALLADEFALTHQSWGSRADPVRRKRPSDTPSEYDVPPECFYCHERGNFIRDCFRLQQKNRRSGNPPPTKPVAACAVISHRLDKCETPHSSFNPFLSAGMVSLLGNKANHEVVILRGTGASQTLIKRSVLPFSVTSWAGYSVLLRGIGMGLVPAEVHHIHLTCPLFTGDLRVAILDELPTQGVDLILGNDAVGGLVLPPPELISSPEIGESLDKLPACVLPRAQLKKDPKVSLNNSVFKMLTDVAKTDPAVKAPDLASRGPQVDLPGSCKSLAGAQKTDHRLASRFVLGDVAPSSDNIQEMVTFPPATTRHELWRFLEMAGFYRYFCHNFSVVAQTLTIPEMSC